MAYIRLTLETADHTESSLLPIDTPAGELRAEDEVLDALQALVVDLFYLAQGNPAADILVMGDPWAPRNGVEAREPEFSAYERELIGRGWPNPKARDLAKLCTCGHPLGEHLRASGMCDHDYCGCGDYNPAPAARPAPPAAPPVLCGCGHPVHHHLRSTGACLWGECMCQEIHPTADWSDADPDPLEEPGTAAEPDLCDCGHERGRHFDAAGHCLETMCMCARYTVTIVKAGPPPADDSEIPF